MHYYQFNIGDYASHTRHLSLIEDAIYRRLLDIYYLSERPLNENLTYVARQINARDYENEVKIVLDEFFQLTEDGWINVRADKEISHFHQKIKQASNAGKASAEARLNRRSTDVQPTNNHKPITNKQKVEIELPDWLPEVHWNDFVEFRKFIKKPMTAKAMQLMISKLERFKDAGHNPIDVLNRSIANNWSDVYEPKPDAASKSKSTPHLKYWQKGYQP